MEQNSAILHVQHFCMWLNRRITFFLLHCFDAYIPWNTVPEDEAEKWVVDIDTYVGKVAVATQVARDFDKAVSKKMREAMRTISDRKNLVYKNPPKVRDRVYLNISSEKRSSSNPKLVNPWQGSYRVIESSENSALITKIIFDREPIRGRFDWSRKLPGEL